ncbi:hypothetical protein SERLA73DRAFT_180842 [Serpula lacrymans var. lacrymans S7.3]|uniref:Uncharacterized protein n=2 Tax=Serpula lacrymans var. lacrymans TaxID=341189 RepID=F8PWJ5_SERL3|nr:uncharacterized protein SERLADRAFT_466625 [Serpula lacrymans var. lacrymans S7.9]EGO00319.1 hypothetical protein SERLA73DRAFT_180842 [Serpula lacrymans var. lacrymans S7.3]EGO25878.1 hypothetical protein SERLADRAFT_466625 [Serpula lacrymans var. lacrymans S7.9]
MPYGRLALPVLAWRVPQSIRRYIAQSFAFTTIYLLPSHICPYCRLATAFLFVLFPIFPLILE